MSQNGKILVHPIDKANKFNIYFSSISSINGDRELPKHRPGPPDFEFEDFMISEQDAIYQLKILNISMPPGPNGISHILLKKACFSIDKPLIKNIQSIP